jgi:hypothetical protein
LKNSKTREGRKLVIGEKKSQNQGRKGDRLLIRNPGMERWLIIERKKGKETDYRREKKTRKGEETD